MDWDDMSEAERRKWAVEFIRYGERLAFAGGTDQARIDLFKEADALIAYINSATASVGSLSRERPAVPATEDTHGRPLLEAI